MVASSEGRERLWASEAKGRVVQERMRRLGSGRGQEGQRRAWKTKWLTSGSGKSQVILLHHLDFSKQNPSTSAQAIMSYYLGPRSSLPPLPVCHLTLSSPSPRWHPRQPPV